MWSECDSVENGDSSKFLGFEDYCEQLASKETSQGAEEAVHMNGGCKHVWLGELQGDFVVLKFQEVCPSTCTHAVLVTRSRIEKDGFISSIAFRTRPSRTKRAVSISSSFSTSAQFIFRSWLLSSAATSSANPQARSAYSGVKVKSAIEVLSSYANALAGRVLPVGPRPCFPDLAI